MDLQNQTLSYHNVDLSMTSRVSFVERTFGGRVGHCSDDGCLSVLDRSSTLATDRSGLAKYL